MTNRRHVIHDGAGFNWAWLAQVVTFPVLATGAALVAQWAVTGDTLKRHDESIKQIMMDAKADRDTFRAEAKADREAFQLSVKTDRAEVAAKVEDEKKARLAVRDEFLTSQKTLTEVLGKLDTRLSVGEKQQDAMGRQIERISDLLQRAPAPLPPVKR